MELLTPRPVGRPVWGFTLVELMVGVAIAGVLLAIATPSLAGLLERRRIIAVAEEVAGMFNYAKSETNSTGTKLTMNMQNSPDGRSSCMRLVTASLLDTCRCDVAEADLCQGSSSTLLRELVVPQASGVSFAASASWGPNSHTASFMRNRRFTEVQDLRIDVTGRRTGAKLRVEYTTVGRVRTCSPDGSIGGYPTC